MEVEIGMEMEVEVEMLVDRTLKTWPFGAPRLINVKNIGMVPMFLINVKKHGRGASVF